MAKSDPRRLEALAGSLERAAASAGVTCRREPIPYGLKLSLAQGAATGVVALYATGKAVPNPGAKQHFAELLAALDATGPVTARTRAARDPVVYPYLGSDESGKGDYFGPLAVAAVLVEDEREAALLAELGVRDSKLITSLSEARRIAGEIRAVCDGRAAELVLAPADYNARQGELRAGGESTNVLLAQLHAEAYDRILAKHAARLAVADKFGDERHIRREMTRRGHRLKLRQETRGERYAAVAAASILARDRCLEWFERAEAEVGERLPRGAFDPRIVEVAARLLARGGEAGLGRYAKLHFRTTEQVRGRIR